MTSARVVVFGGTGFIGSHLLASLPCSETRIIVRRPLQGWGGEQIEIADPTAEGDLGTLLKGCDAVVNLVAHAHTGAGVGHRHKSRCFKINSEFPARLATACRKSHVRHLVHLSSLGAVATECNEVLNEESPPRPASIYGQSKLAGEFQLREALAEGETSWTILRPPLVYGAGNPANMSRLVSLLRRNVPLPLGRVKNRRSFIYVRNLVDVILRCIDHPGAANRILHVSDDNDVSTAEFVTMLAEALGTRAVLLPIPSVVLDVLEALPGGGALRKLRASLATHIGLLKSHLDWNPPFPMEKGLAETASAFVSGLPS